MNGTVESLKILYQKMGGSPEDVENITTIPDMIDMLSGLDTVNRNLTSEDDGEGNVEILLKQEEEGGE